MIVKNKLLKKTSILLALTLLMSSLVYAENDVNVDGTGGVSGGTGGYSENSNYMWQNKSVRAARISLWDIENQTLVYGKIRDLVDYNTLSKSEVEKSRRLTTLTKPQIINMNYKYSKDGSKVERIADNIERYLDYQIDDIPLEETTFQTMGGTTLLYPESITFPDFYVTWTSDSHDGSDDTRLKHLKEWYSQDEHVEEILNAFSATEDIIEKYKNQKISILIEPLLYFGTNNNECEVRNENYGF